METAQLVETVTIDSGKVDLGDPNGDDKAALAAENSDTSTESSTAAVANDAKTKPAAKTYDSLEAVLQAMTDQEEQLRAIKSQVQELLSTNALLKKSVKQIVANAQKDDSAQQELVQARRKLNTLKNFLATV